MEILVTSFILIMASSTPEPQRPVAPVKMRCMSLRCDEWNSVARERPREKDVDGEDISEDEFYTCSHWAPCRRRGCGGSRQPKVSHRL